MKTTANVTRNLPVSAERPEIEADAGTTKCQVYSRGWAPNGGFVFTYCEGLQRYLISWSVADRWRTRRHLRVCAVHGLEFAQAHDLGLDGAAHGPATAAVSAQPIGDPFEDSTAADSDAPYARVRGGR